MLVTLVCAERIYSLHLPEKIAGKYWIEDDNNANNKILAFEASQNGSEWLIRANKNIRFLDESAKSGNELHLEEGKIYHVLFVATGKGVAILTERFTEDRGLYKKMLISRDTEIKIGKEPDNDIVFENPYVGGHHCVLSYKGGAWSINDNKSRNGVYVNKLRVQGERALRPGDVIFILGLKIIIGSSFISANNPDNRVRFNPNIFMEFIKDENTSDEIKEIEEKPYYYRSPRFIREIESTELKVDAPTKNEDTQSAPILLTMGSSLVMGLASMSVGVISVVNNLNNGGSVSNAAIAMVSPAAMLLGMILFPVLIRNREKRVKHEREAMRRSKYAKYLNNLREEIKRNIALQQELLNENNPAITDICARNDFWDSKLWSKTPAQHDFTFVRLGMGNLPMYGDIIFPDDRFSIDDDVLRNALFDFQKEDRLLLDVPIGVSMSDCRVLGIVGDDRGIQNLLTNIVLQFFLLHSYDEVKMVFLYDKKDEEKYSFIRNAQHVWDNDGKRRFLAVTEEGLKELSTEINDIISDRREIAAADKKAQVILPHYIVVSASRDLSNKCAFMTDIMQDRNIGGFSVICAFDEMRSLPKECEIIVQVSGKQGIVYSSSMNRNERINFAQDIVSTAFAKDMVGRMAERKLDLSQGRYILPEMYTFMDMFGVGKCEHLNILYRWKNSNPVKTLQTPVGVGTDGEPFYLDLHEKFHGPHGLVAGMTGSGKSEFIITYILSLAVNYHPNEVAFVLIDYKGGGLTGAFENERYRLPHLAGTITNLDGGTIMRSILSIKSELRKRQAIFNRARDIANEGTMDIYRYQKMYRDGLVSDPMPHLFIISDEFAELKTQQPEFMEQLISTSRIGRSLGVHLILATQKPSGVVNDQIWANSKFKVCLKVQDKADSNDMLKRPDAASISETGRFYLQVGYNELFEMGQSGWAGAPYTDSDVSYTERNVGVEVIDDLGNVTDRMRKSASSSSRNKGKQIVRVMEYIDKLAKDEEISVRQLWKPEIPADIRLEDTIRKYEYTTKKNEGLCAVIGELDDPYNQDQRILDYNFTEEGNAVIYGTPGSGKELMIDAILYSLYSNYSPEELNTFIFDFDAETLGMFKDAPQTGGFTVDGEDEKIENCIKMLERQTKERKKLFSEFGGSITKYNAVNKDKLPYILVIVHNYSHFMESYDKYDDRMVALTRECQKYGIYFILTATNTMAIRYRMQQNFKRLFVMQMNDKADYVSLLGNTGGVVPSSIKGRGIIKNDETYVFQAAHIIGEEEDLNEHTREFCSNLMKQYGAIKAQQVATVPKFVSGAAAAGAVGDLSEVPVGISYETYDYLKIDLKEKMILTILSENGREAAMAGAGTAETVSQIPGVRTIILDPSKQMSKVLDGSCEILEDDFENHVVKLFEMCRDRNNDYKDTNGNPTIDMSPVIVIINGYDKIRASLSFDVKDKLKVLLDKAESFWNIMFVVCDISGNATHWRMEDWVIDHCAGEGIWAGNGIDDQISLEIYEKAKSLKETISSNTGYFVSGGKATKIRLIMPKALEVDYEQ